MRTAELRNNNGTMNYYNGSLSFKNLITGDVTRFLGTEEFVLYLEENGEICAIPSSLFRCAGISCKDGAFSLRYIRGSVEAKVVYRSTESTFVKTVEVSSANEITVKRIVTECRSVCGNFCGGGEGIPVFIDDKMWCGIEFPSAINRYDSCGLSFAQAPFATTKAFESFPVVYGLASGGDVKKTFENYVKGFSIPKKPLRVYCDWGAHDDLSDTVYLTEEFSHKNIGEVKTFAKMSDVPIDYYLMDAFWFEENNPYVDFKRKTFPSGPDSVLKELSDGGMKYGLWFDLNFIHAHMKGWERFSNMIGKEASCFAVDEVAELMYEAVKHHILHHGVKMIKFDFAYFECKNPDHGHSVEHLESKERSILNFIRMVDRLRTIEPELVILCYNGWTISLDWIGCVCERSGYAVSPYWCKYVDYLYCGDPRPSEISSKRVEDSVVYYTDAMIRNFREAFIPFECIDDHGTMMGETDTIYHLGTKMFRCGVLMNVMRGTCKLNPYGLLSGLDEADAEYYRYVSDIYDKSIARGYQCSFVLGDARRGEVYGYSLSGSNHGYTVVLNPQKHSVCVNLCLEQWNGARIKSIKRIENGKIVRARTSVTEGGLSVNLDPNGYALIEWNVVNDVTADYSVTLCPKEKLAVVTEGCTAIALSFRDAANNRPIRTGYGYPEGLTVTCDGKSLVANNQRAVWSGISWLYFELSGQNKICIEYNGDKDLILKYELIREGN